MYAIELNSCSLLEWGGNDCLKARGAGFISQSDFVKASGCVSNFTGVLKL